MSPATTMRLLSLSAALAACLSACSGGSSASSTALGPAPVGNSLAGPIRPELGKIQHIVIIMQENR